MKRSSDVPLYRQLFYILMKDIQDGQWAVGERLPPERALADQYKVSRITAVKAVDALVKAGIVYREQGRGTFVANQDFGRFSFNSFTADMRASGKRPSSRVTEFVLTKAKGMIAEKLKLPEGHEYYAVTRVRLADDAPVALQRHLIPAENCPGLKASDMEQGSLISLLCNSYGVIPAWTEPVIKLGYATEREAQVLEVPAGSPLLSVDSVTYTETFDVVEWVITVYRGENTVLYLGRQRLHESL